MSFHIEASIGDIAETILLPGDPMRAKYIVENYLEDAVCYNRIRGILGYTGTYKGKRISVQGTGMGMPSMSIYATELAHDYGVRNLIRIGSSGSYHPDIKHMDLVLGTGACTSSAMFKHEFENFNYAPTAHFDLLRAAYDTGSKMSLPVRAGLVMTEDHFYDGNAHMYEKLAAYQVLASDNETAALYMVAAKYNARALSILTVTDHMLTNQTVTSQERETALHDMIRLGLETAFTL
ncbi:purine-nucleoside phosphorylase [Paenibacillus sp. UMB4589-SE434]|uniref:purine-nucleoside phosphorylase n=1 Tax=Paenibacillus sp. UMB4589-SE434 TaxID=3046314 RepID=UPI00255149E5|nr:purine-nucleoside phosphorylase [Paenibacillus sp. UMB4589-SE434]MDK8183288.1 purine-nucleoside phosphorylase [Paenibacillus sp. UMB4589-SE434]